MRVALVVVTVLGMTVAAAGQPGITERISVSSSGEQGGDYRERCPSISADGRFVSFISAASNLVPGDANGFCDVFVRDRELGTTELVSLSSSGEQGNGDSAAGWLREVSISADGRFVSFPSAASNLVPGDANGFCDVFVRDRELGTTELVSLSSLGEQGNGDSGEAYSGGVSISADGRFVAFCSSATNLVPGDTIRNSDIFVRDRLLALTELVSVSSSGKQVAEESEAPSISGDGRLVAFCSWANNLVPGDINAYGDVFVRDRLTGITERVSVSSEGIQGNHESGYPSISADGRYVAFDSYAWNLVPGEVNDRVRDVFVRDRLTGTTELMSLSSGGEHGNEDSYRPSISADGRFVVFDSVANNLVAADDNYEWDAFLRDRMARTTELVSLSSCGEQGDDPSYSPCISADGRFVAFCSWADNLVADDTNGLLDAFVRDRLQRYDVSGQVTFGDLQAAAPPCVELRLTWNGEPPWYGQAPLDPDGSYVLSLPAGLLTLSIKHTHWLRRTVEADNSSGPVSGVDFHLVNGDCYDDNAVDLLDLTQVLAHFGESGGMPDVNESGTVDLADLNVVLLRFGLTGDE
jgi:Tol biopolymer transport system component